MAKPNSINLKQLSHKLSIKRSSSLAPAPVVVPNQTARATLSLAPARTASRILLEKRRTKQRNASTGACNLIKILILCACEIGLIDALAATGRVIDPLLAGRTGAASLTLAGTGREVIGSAIAALEAGAAAAGLHIVGQGKWAVCVIGAAVDDLDGQIVDAALEVQRE